MAMVTKECLKCNTKTKFEKISVTTACPNCGVIYSKAESSSVYRDPPSKVHSKRNSKYQNRSRGKKSNNLSTYLFWLILLIAGLVFLGNSDLEKIKTQVAQFFEVDKETIKSEITDNDTLIVSDLECELTELHPGMNTGVFIANVSMKIKLNYYKNLHIYGRVEILDKSYTAIRTPTFNMGVVSAGTTRKFGKQFKITGVKDARYCRLKEFQTINDAPIGFTSK